MPGKNKGATKTVIEVGRPKKATDKTEIMVNPPKKDKSAMIVVNPPKKSKDAEIIVKQPKKQSKTEMYVGPPKEQKGATNPAQANEDNLVNLNDEQLGDLFNQATGGWPVFGDETKKDEDLGWNDLKDENG